MKPFAICSLLRKPILAVKPNFWKCSRSLTTAATLQDIRQELQQQQAGSVELKQNAETGIAILTLNNPGRKNALSGSMMVDLADHVTTLSQWKEGKGVILRGADNTFCSGGDLRTLAHNPVSGQNMSVFMHDLLTRFHSLPLISLALVQGVAVGGGAELATACDFRAMTSDARIGFVQIRMGVTTGWGAATRLVRLLGRRKTLELLCSGKVLDAESAHRFGLADFILHDRNGSPCLQETEALLQSCCSGPAGLVRSVKEMVTNIEGCQTKEEALELERAVFSSFWGGEFHMKALEKNIKHS